jgi:hypothetical protein
MHPWRAIDGKKTLAHLLLFAIVYEYFVFTLGAHYFARAAPATLNPIMLFRLFQKAIQIFFTLTCCRTRAEISSALNWQLLFFPAFERIHRAYTQLFSKVLTPSSSARRERFEKPFRLLFSLMLMRAAAERGDSRLDSRCDLSIINFFPLERARQTSPNKLFSESRLYMCCMHARIISSSARASKNERVNTKRMGIFTESVSK